MPSTTMAKSFAKAFYNSVQWQRARQTALERSGGLCERCYQKGIIRTADAVHHIVWLTPQNIHDPEITLGQKNLIALCQDCHAEAHAIRKNSRRYSVTKNGEIIIKDKRQE